ncbi:MAG: helix-turn-helix domain-containing protein [Verrucomicrobia bacterium]|nr:helix-turn-helix domain-containing protein [Verrucomicrobiota bacterium]
MSQEPENRNEVIVSTEPTDKKIVSITEAAKLNNVTRQAIYVAIKLNKLRATKETSRWMINMEDLNDYRKQKYSRTKSTFQGELLFDNTKGYYSINQVSKMLNVPAQKIYYATRAGYLKAHRRGAAWVVRLEDVKEYQETYLTSKVSKKPVVLQAG